MIKAENGTVRLEGHPALLEVELISAIKGFYNALCSEYGEEFAESRIDFVLEKALESDEVETVHECIKGILRGILKEMEGEK